ncbi:MAG: hypothetical protein ACYDG6_04245 [Thermincolia bacterium]
MTNGLKIDFIIHWLWAVVFGLLLITGMVLMGAKFGWLMNYQIPLADYLHRTLAAAFVILALISMGLEVYRQSKANSPAMPWLVICKSGMGIFNLAVTLLFVLSGIFIWICTEFPHSILGFAYIIHDLLTFISLPVIIWHIYDKAYALPRE